MSFYRVACWGQTITTLHTGRENNPIARLRNDISGLEFTKALRRLSICCLSSKNEVSNHEKKSVSTTKIETASYLPLEDKDA